MSWTAERIDQARRLFIEQELSATETAKRMGGHLTRNAIIGMARRMGWKKGRKPAEAKPIMDRTIKPRASKAKATTPKDLKGLVTGVTFPPMKPEELDQKRAELAAEGKRAIKGMDAVANDDAVPLMQAVFGHCRWPVGTPDQPRNQLVCGQPVFEGVEKCSYCLTHANRAFARDVSQPKPKDNLARAVRRWAA